MTKVVGGVAEAAAGAAITVKTGGLAAAGGVAMAVDGASRAQGGVADFANLFRSPESQLGNWDTVEVGFQQALAGYKSGKGSVQFRLDEPLPEDLVREIVAFRVREVEDEARRR